MRKIVLMVAVAAMVIETSAQEATVNTSRAALYDSTQVEALQEVVVKGVRAQKNAPYAVSNLKKQQLSEHAKTGKELPFLFSQTPGVTAWSGKQDCYNVYFNGSLQFGDCKVNQKG